MKERWRKCFGGFYAVSDRGRVRRERGGCGARIGRLLKASPGSVGYPVVDIKIRGGSIKTLVHRMVAKAFIGPCPSGKEVNHKNGVKTDNRIGNLEYLTSSDNHRHAFRLGLQPRPVGERHPLAKLTDGAVRAIRAARADGVPLKALAAQFGVAIQTVCGVTKRRNWRHVA